MKKLTLIFFALLSIVKVSGQVNSCYGDAETGKKILLPFEKDRTLTYHIKHEFKLQTLTGFTPSIYSVSFNHAWVDEPMTFCLDYEVNPENQPPGFEPYAMDTIINDGAYNNNQIQVDSLVMPLSPHGAQQTDSAYAENCNSRSKASTCITIDSVHSNFVEGAIQSYGFSQAINPTNNTDAYAFSWSGVTVEDGQPIKVGDIRWEPQLKQTVKGKSRSIRQKAGTNDPVMFRAENLLTGDTASGTLLSVVMRFQTDDDTLDVTNYWENDTVHLESDSILFKIHFPSGYTAQQGFIYLLVQNGFVVQAQKSGVFIPVTLPLIGTPVPLSFPLVNRIDFHYNMDTTGLFGGDPMFGQIFMYGNPERNFVRTHDTVSKLVPHIRKPSCPGNADGKIELAVNYGTPPYTFTWSTGATTQNIIGLTAGIYSVMVFDNFGMPATGVYTVSDPFLLVPASTVTHVTCKGAHDGTILANATGGTPPYHYLWNNGSTNALRSGLYPKTYTVTITDSKGCFVIASYVVLQSPTYLNATVTKKNIKCAGKCNGQATVNPTGGMPPYTYLWNSGDVTSTAINLCAGTYTCTVTDAFGCSKTKTATLTQNPPIVIIVTPSGSTATALVSGGIPPYTFSWNTVPPQTTTTATGLISGHTYKVKVTDFKNCTKTLTFTQPFSKNGITQDALIVYPNPAGNVLNVQFSSEGNAMLLITDITGRIVYEAVTVSGSQLQTSEINTTQLPDGIYMLTIRTDAVIQNKKLVIKRNE